MTVETIVKLEPIKETEAKIVSISIVERKKSIMM